MIVRLVDCRPRTAFEAGHLPGAVHLDPETQLSAPPIDPAVGGRHPLPDPHVLATVFAGAGIDAETFVLAYDEGTGWAARCWWLLRHLGHDAAGSFDRRAYVGPLVTAEPRVDRAAFADPGVVPSIVGRTVHVKVPATSANLGPGFDHAAVALTLWNELEVTAGEGVTVEGEGAGELPADATNLAVRAFALLADPAGRAFRFRNRIPLERGLGSSAAAIALGLAAARPDGDAEELLAAGLELESHADNLAAALAGGVTLTWEGRIARIATTLPLAPVALVPKERTSTEASRRSLPATVSHADAAANAGRAALLAAGAAAGDSDLFAAGLDDRLHEPYRPSAELDAIRAELPTGARGATLSGSGPTVITWADDSSACATELAARFPGHDVLELAVTERGAL